MTDYEPWVPSPQPYWCTHPFVRCFDSLQIRDTESAIQIQQAWRTYQENGWLRSEYKKRRSPALSYCHLRTAHTPERKKKKGILVSSHVG